MLLYDKHASIRHSQAQRVDAAQLINIKWSRGVDRSFRSEMERIVNEALGQVGNALDVVLRGVAKRALPAYRLAEPSEIPHQREADDDRVE